MGPNGMSADFNRQQGGQRGQMGGRGGNRGGRGGNRGGSKDAMMGGMGLDNIVGMLYKYIDSEVERRMAERGCTAGKPEMPGMSKNWSQKEHGGVEAPMPAMPWPTKENHKGGRHLEEDPSFL